MRAVSTINLWVVAVAERMKLSVDEVLDMDLEAFSTVIGAIQAEFWHERRRRKD